MKKFLSLILALAMVACMSVTAFAADDGTTVLTVEVPIEPSYTLHIPANMPLEYGNTEKQTIGDLYVTDVDGFAIIRCAPKYTDLINCTDSSDIISLTLFSSYPNATQHVNDDELTKDGRAIQLKWNDVTNIAGWENGYRLSTLSAQVSDWSGATPGATYQSTITYIVTTE